MQTRNHQVIVVSQGGNRRLALAVGLAVSSAQMSAIASGFQMVNTWGAESIKAYAPSTGQTKPMPTALQTALSAGPSIAAFLDGNFERAAVKTNVVQPLLVIAAAFEAETKGEGAFARGTERESIVEAIRQIRTAAEYLTKAVEARRQARSDERTQPQSLRMRAGGAPIIVAVCANPQDAAAYTAALQQYGAEQSASGPRNRQPVPAFYEETVMVDGVGEFTLTFHNVSGEFAIAQYYSGAANLLSQVGQQIEANATEIAKQFGQGAASQVVLAFGDEAHTKVVISSASEGAEFTEPQIKRLAEALATQARQVGTVDPTSNFIVEAPVQIGTDLRTTTAQSAPLAA